MKTRDDNKGEKKKELIKFFIQLFFVLMAVFLITKFWLPTVRVTSESMEPTLYKGDYLIGTKIFKNVERGDIVGLRYPVDRNLIIIKRVIGLPGEKVSIKNGKVYINGSPLEEDYIKYEWTRYKDGYEFEVPDGCYFMMGDNRNWSLDSRFWADEAEKNQLKDKDGGTESFTFVPRNDILLRVKKRKSTENKPYSFSFSAKMF